VLGLEHDRVGGGRQHARLHVDWIPDRAGSGEGIAHRVTVHQVAHQVPVAVFADEPDVAELAAAQPHCGEQQLDARPRDEGPVDAHVVDAGDGVERVEVRALQEGHHLVNLALGGAQVHKRDPERAQQDQVRSSGPDLREHIAQELVGKLGDLEGESRVVVDGQRFQGGARRVHVTR